MKTFMKCTSYYAIWLSVTNLLKAFSEIILLVIPKFFPSLS